MSQNTTVCKTTHVDMSHKFWRVNFLRIPLDCEKSENFTHTKNTYNVVYLLTKMHSNWERCHRIRIHVG